MRRTSLRFCVIGAGSAQRMTAPATVFDGTPIYRKPPDEQSLRQRLVTYHSPYHEELSTLIDRMLMECERVLLLDLHAFFGPIAEDVCIGDLRSCRVGKRRPLWQAMLSSGNASGRSATNLSRGAT